MNLISVSGGGDVEPEVAQQVLRTCVANCGLCPHVGCAKEGSFAKHCGDCHCPNATTTSVVSQMPVSNTPFFSGVFQAN
nr:hypothetical protein [Arthrobacter sedimenti]